MFARESPSFIKTDDNFERSYLYLTRICHLIWTELSPLMYSIHNPDTRCRWDSFDLAYLNDINYFLVFVVVPSELSREAYEKMVMTVDKDYCVGIREFFLVYYQLKNISVLVPSFYPTSTVRYHYDRWYYTHCYKEDSVLDHRIGDLRYFQGRRWHDYLRDRDCSNGLDRCNINVIANNFDDREQIYNSAAIFTVTHFALR
jgi:hypothetical protein